MLNGNDFKDVTESFELLPEDVTAQNKSMFVEFFRQQQVFKIEGKNYNKSFDVWGFIILNSTDNKTIVRLKKYCSCLQFLLLSAIVAVITLVIYINQKGS